jgi:F0F1-type ATP synthase assembly protein I
MADDGSRDGPPQGQSHGQPEGLRGRDLIGLGGMLAGSLIAFTALGYLLDQAIDTTPVFTLAGIGLGMVAGGVGFWARVRSALKDSTPRDPGSS